MTYLSLNDLNVVLKLHLEKSLVLNSNLYFTVDVLIQTGIRFSELNKNLFYLIDDDIIELHTKKCSDIRIFKKNDVPLHLYNSIVNNDFSLYLSNYQTFLYYYHQLPFSYLRQSKAECLRAHLYRHVYCKNVYYSTNDYNYVKSKLGDKNMDVVIGYVNSKIYC